MNKIKYSAPELEIVKLKISRSVLAESVTTTPENPTDIIATEGDFEFGS